MFVPNVNLFYPDDKGNVLVVCRRDNAHLFGLPGGKVDPIDIADAQGDADYVLRIGCSREVLEETGLVVLPHHLVKVFSAECFVYGTDSKMWPNVTFMARKITGMLQPREGEPACSWQPIDKLLTQSPFHEYNAAMLRAIGYPR